MTRSRILIVVLRTIGAVAGGLVLVVGSIYAVSEWKLRRTYEAPLVDLHVATASDPAEGEHMAKLIGCWAGCHGPRGEGGDEAVKGLRHVTAPTLSDVLPAYTDAELVRLIRYGVKRDGTSAVGMISYTFWPLGDADLANIIAHLRAQPRVPAVPPTRELTLRGRVAMITGEWGVAATLVDRSIPRWGELPRNTSFERGRYLASIICSECHGLDFRGNALEGGPSLAIVGIYRPDQFEHLLHTGEPIGGRDIPQMGWMKNVDFRDREVADLYNFLREYHGLAPASGSALQDR